MSVYIEHIRQFRPGTIGSLLLFVLLLIPPAAAAQDLPCLSCHGELASKTNVHLAVTMGCGLCHQEPHAKGMPELSLIMDTPDLCLMCHSPESFSKAFGHAPVQAGQCASCHDPHSSANTGLLISGGSELCFQCHSPESFSKAFGHAPVQAGQCASCHDPHSSANTGLLISGGSELCFQCHSDQIGNKRHVHPPVAEGKCGSCHSSHSTEYDGLLSQPINALCGFCHPGEADGAHVLVGFGLGDKHPVHGFSDPLHPNRELACISCHQSHAGNARSLFVESEISTGQDSENLCLRCHRRIRVEL